MSEAQNSTPSRDPTARLQSAIETLEKFNSEGSSRSYLHTSFSGTLPVNGASPISKTVSLVRGMNSNTKREELLDAIGVVKSYHTLLEVLKKGTEDQKLLAERADKAFEGYNAIVARIKEAPTSLGSRIARFVLSRASQNPQEQEFPGKIELPQEQKTQLEIENRTISDRLYRLIDQADIPADTTLTVSEADVFRMKAISLLSPHFFSFEDIQKTLHKTPIRIQLNRPTDETSALLGIHQTISPFPGEVIILKGSFKRDPRNLTYSMPVSGSFQANSQSVQTGFPHPLQNCGWSLSDALLPKHPQRPDQMALFTPLLDNKEKAAEKLLPQGNLNKKAKRVLKNKVQAFDDHKEEFLELHLRLLRAIVRASNRKLSDLQPTIDRYTESVACHPTPYHYLSETHNIIMENFVERPLQVLQGIWIGRSEPRLFDEDPNIIADIVRKHLSDEREKARAEIRNLQNDNNCEIQTVLLDFILSFGLVIAEGCESVICQQLSEIMHFFPATLTDFQQKLQAAAIIQLTTFHAEIFSENEAKQVDSLRNQLLSDIELFEAERLDSLERECVHLVHELEGYYNTRYLQRPI